MVVIRSWYSAYGFGFVLVNYAKTFLTGALPEATHMPIRFESSDEDPWLQGALIECSSEPMRAVSITGVQEPL